MTYLFSLLSATMVRLGLKKSAWRKIQCLLRKASTRRGSEKLLVLADTFPLKLQISIEDLPSVNPAIRYAVTAALEEMVERYSEKELLNLWNKQLSDQIRKRGGSDAAREILRELTAAVRFKRAAAEVPKAPRNIFVDMEISQ